MDGGSIWLLTAVGFLVVIIMCQAALNLWLIMRGVELTRNTSRVEVLAQESERHAMEKVEALRDKVKDLESALSVRLDANIALLEKLILSLKRPSDET